MPTDKKSAKKTGKSLPERKTEALSIRIDPKVRYGLELLARAHRRSVTGVVEWSIVEAFRNNTIRDDGGSEVTFETALATLWSVNEVERLLGMFFNYQQLLTFEEERLVMVLVKTSELWTDHARRSYGLFRWTAVLENWETLKPVAVAASERTTIVGLTYAELTEARLDFLGIDPDIPF